MEVFLGLLLLIVIGGLLSSRSKQKNESQRLSAVDGSASKTVPKSDTVLDPSVNESDLEIFATPSYLDTLPGKAFEELIAELLKAMGLEIIQYQQSNGADGGIDIVAVHKTDLAAVTYAIQCKRHNEKIGVKHVRELYGIVTGQHYDKGIFITSSTFTKEAQEFAKGKQLELIDREKLEDLLHKYLKRPAQSFGEGLQQELKNELKTQAVDQRQITKATEEIDVTFYSIVRSYWISRDDYTKVKHWLEVGEKPLGLLVGKTNEGGRVYLLFTDQRIIVVSYDGKQILALGDPRKGFRMYYPMVEPGKAPQYVNLDIYTFDSQTKHYAKLPREELQAIKIKYQMLYKNYK